MLKEKLYGIIKPYTEKEFQTNSHFIDDLNFDSLMVVEFIMEMEDKFDIEINDDEVSKIAYVQDAIDLLESKVNANV